MTTTSLETVGPFTVHELPIGGRVFYRDSDHSYWRDVKQKGDDWSGTGRLLGVSTAAKIITAIKACGLSRRSIMTLRMPILTSNSTTTGSSKARPNAITNCVVNE